MTEDLALVHPTVTPFWGMPFVVAPPMVTDEHLISFSEALIVPNVIIQTPMDEECSTFIAPLVKTLIEAQGYVIIECPETGQPFSLGQIRPGAMEEDPLSKEKVTQRLCYLVHFNEKSRPEDIARWWKFSSTVWFVYRGDVNRLGDILSQADDEEVLEEYREQKAFIEAEREAGNDVSEMTLDPVGLNESRVIIVGDSKKLEEKMRLVPLSKFVFSTTDDGFLEY